MLTSIKPPPGERCTPGVRPRMDLKSRPSVGRSRMDVDTTAILDLPTEGRDFKSILGLTPGVQRSPGGGFMDVSINGQRTSTNNYMIDGVPNNDRFYGNELVGQPGLLGVPSALLGNDSIGEYTVQQLPTAENGVKGGAAINVTLKSGTNQFHGTAFYFGDYDWLNANNFFSRSEEHTSELQSRLHLVCRLLLGKKKHTQTFHQPIPC